MKEMNPLRELETDKALAHCNGDANSEICFLSLSDNDSPSVRTLVVREISDSGVYFFLNKTSDKWKQIERNKLSEVLFWYPSLKTQYRVFGEIEELPRTSIKGHWNKRPLESKYMDYAYEHFAEQSQEIPSEKALKDFVNELRDQTEPNKLVPPSSASGIRIIAASVEKLLLDEHNFHSRKKFTKESESWRQIFLMP